jgi:hypothetical protein
MKIKITEIDTEEGKTPIELEDIELSENKHGQIILSFNTKNHKYLDIGYGIASFHVDGEYCEFGSRGFVIETNDLFQPKELSFEIPESSLTLYLIPESDEEKQKLWGISAILPQKWSYVICIVPYKDFYKH